MVPILKGPLFRSSLYLDSCNSDPALCRFCYLNLAICELFSSTLTWWSDSSDSSVNSQFSHPVSVINYLCTLILYRPPVFLTINLFLIDFSWIRALYIFYKSKLQYFVLSDNQICFVESSESYHCVIFIFEWSKDFKC